MKEVREICVIGAGRIGREIALVFAAFGYRVQLRDVKKRPLAESSRLLGEAKNTIEGSLRLLREEDAISEDIETVLDRISLLSGLDRSLASVDYLVEAIPENLDVKKQFFSSLEDFVTDDAILSSTSSSISPSQIAAAISKKSRFLNTHWLNPAELMPLVEVVKSKYTSAETVTRVVKLLESVGKVPVVLEDSPGYIGPRIQALVMNEVVRIIEAGVATPDQVDKAIMAGIGFRLSVQGMAEFIDWGGLDILYHVSSYLKGALNDSRFEPPALLRKKIESGETGMDVRRGLLDYSSFDVNELKTRRTREFIARLKQLNLLPASRSRTH